MRKRSLCSLLLLICVAQVVAFDAHTEPYHRLMAKQWLKVILKQPLIGV
ncbi:MAG TPA: hypothetical protein VGK36_18125 [Candidatus Angelobacter sp.]